MKLTTIFFLTTLVLCFCLFFSIKTCNKNKKEIKTIETISKQLIHDTVYRNIDKNGTVHSQANVVSGDLRAVKVFFGKKIDSLTEALNIANKQLDEFITLRLSDTGDFIATLSNNNNGTKSFDWQDDYLEVSGLITDTSINCHYKIEVPLDIAVFWRRKHHFWFVRYGKKIYKIDASSKNPNVLVQDLLNVKINKE